MTVTINGSGTMTGLAVGGLNDNIITKNEMATGGAWAPAGTVLQVVDSGHQNTSVSATTTTFVDGNCTATITPSASSSKILVLVQQTIQVWNSAPYATGRWKLARNINGGSFSDIYIDYDTFNGNIFAYDYGGSGINVYRPTSYQMLDSPNTTNACIYKT